MVAYLGFQSGDVDVMAVLVEEEVTETVLVVEAAAPQSLAEAIHVFD